MKLAKEAFADRFRHARNRRRQRQELIDYLASDHRVHCGNRNVCFGPLADKVRRSKAAPIRSPRWHGAGLKLAT
jgi:hypothetical protein